MRIDDFIIEQYCPPFLIAEIGVNHNGCFDTAMKMVDAAAASGANALKFQTFVVDELVTKTAPKARYQMQNSPKIESQYEMLSKLCLTETEFEKLKSYCAEKKLTFLSSPFDVPSVEFLDSLGVGAIKIPSGEITNMPYLREIAKTNRNVILSTGMANLGEIESAINILRTENLNSICLLHCISDYPADITTMNLKAIKTLQSCFQIPVGLSDHTLGFTAAVVAVAYGAPIIEKHFTLDKNMAGPDHKASMDPSEFCQLRVMLDNAYASLGNGVKKASAAELDTRDVARKSLTVIVDIAEGAIIKQEMLALKRPGTGLSAADLKHVVGRVAARSISSGTTLEITHLR